MKRSAGPMPKLCVRKITNISSFQDKTASPSSSVPPSPHSLTPFTSRIPPPSTPPTTPSASRSILSLPLIRSSRVSLDHSPHDSNQRHNEHSSRQVGNNDNNKKLSGHPKGGGTAGEQGGGGGRGREGGGKRNSDSFNGGSQSSDDTRQKKRRREGSDTNPPSVRDWSCVLCNLGNNVSDLSYLYGPYSVNNRTEGKERHEEWSIINKSVCGIIIIIIIMCRSVDPQDVRSMGFWCVYHW